MFDDPRGHANGHLPHAQDAEKLPIELAPVHDLLVATSEQWRASLPAADRLAAFARSLPNVPLRQTLSQMTTLGVRGQRFPWSCRPGRHSVRVPCQQLPQQSPLPPCLAGCSSISPRAVFQIFFSIQQ